MMKLMKSYDTLRHRTTDYGWIPVFVGRKRKKEKRKRERRRRKREIFLVLRVLIALHNLKHSKAARFLV
jgi:hypothetical protein